MGPVKQMVRYKTLCHSMFSARADPCKYQCNKIWQTEKNLAKLGKIPARDPHELCPYLFLERSNPLSAPSHSPPLILCQKELFLKIYPSARLCKIFAMFPGLCSFYLSCKVHHFIFHFSETEKPYS